MLYISKHLQVLQIPQMLDCAKIILLLEIKTFFCRKLVSKGRKQGKHTEQSESSFISMLFPYSANAEEAMETKIIPSFLFLFIQTEYLCRVLFPQPPMNARPTDEKGIRCKS